MPLEGSGDLNTLPREAVVGPATSHSAGLSRYIQVWTSHPRWPTAILTFPFLQGQAVWSTHR